MAKTIPAGKYVEGVESIYVEMPKYEKGHDGSDGKCDCIGMGRGALIREGITETPNLYGTNQAARFAIRNLQPVDVNRLRIGDVVLKGRQPGESGYDLPEKYRIGGSSYTGDLTDYYHFGTVTRVQPLEITHMTSPKPKKDTKIGNWKYMGQLPQVDYGAEAEPAPEPDPGEITRKTVRRGDRGSDVMYVQDLLQALGYDIGDSGADGIFGKKTESAVREFQKKSGLDPDGIVGPRTYAAMEKMIEDEMDADTGGGPYTVIIKDLQKEQAEAICREWKGAEIIKNT